MCLKAINFFWPRLEPITITEQEEQCELKSNDIDLIKKTDWSKEKELALSEAQRIASEEESRIRTVESKATNLLLFVAALIPLLIYLGTTLLGVDLKGTSTWVTILILATAVIYLVKASLWSFKTINVGNYHRVYSGDLVKIWGNATQYEGLIIEVLSATRLNQETINSKVTAFKMTHAFLLRAIVSLSLLLLVQVFLKVWSVWKQPLFETLHGWFC